MSFFTSVGVSDFVSTVGLIVALSVYLGAVRHSLLKNLPIGRADRLKRLGYLLVLVVPEILLVFVGLDFTYFFVRYNVWVDQVPQWERTGFFVFGITIFILAAFHGWEWVKTVMKIIETYKSPESTTGAADKAFDAANKNVEAATALQEAAKTLKDAISSLKREEGDVDKIIGKL